MLVKLSGISKYLIELHIWNAPKPIEINPVFIFTDFKLRQPEKVPISNDVTLVGISTDDRLVAEKAFLPMNSVLLGKLILINLLHVSKALISIFVIVGGSLTLVSSILL